MRRVRQRQQDENSCESDTQSILSSEFDELNYARIYDTPVSNFLTPSKKKQLIKKKNSNFHHQENQDWRKIFTQTIKNKTNQSDRTCTPEKLKKIKQKYPTSVINTKYGTITVKVKNKTELKYQNLCSICLDLHTDNQGILGCGHKFCYDCIQEWTKTSTNCPCCRFNFQHLIKVTLNDNKIQTNRQLIKVESKQMVYNELDYFVCLQCGRGDDEDVLLICDSCDFYCCHVYCDRELNNRFPSADWYCKHCKDIIRESQIHQNQRNRLNLTDHLSEVETVIITRNGDTQTLPERSQVTQSNYQMENRQTINQVMVQRLRRSNTNTNHERSKARQIFSEYKPPQNNRLQSVIDRIAYNNTSRNLRNLRRRRNY